MMTSLDPAKLRFLLIPTRFPSEKHKDDYLKAYTCWKAVWGHTFKDEMNIDEQLFSDNFTKASHMAIIFYGEEVACLTTMNYLDLNSPVVKDDSYFKIWPEVPLRRLHKEARTVMVSGNLSLNFNFRRGAYGISWKDLMFAFQVKHLKNSSHDAVIASVRVEKGMEESANRTGAYTLARDVPYTIPGRKVALVLWRKGLDEKSLDQNLYELVNYTWNNSSEIVESYSPNKEVKDVA